MKRNKAFLSVAICFFVALFILLARSDYCHSSYDEKSFKECHDQFIKDLKEFQKTNESFVGRHFWKIVGSAVAIIIFITGIIIFISGIAGAPVAVPAGGAACALVYGGGALTAWILGISIFTSSILSGFLIDEMKKQRHGNNAIIMEIDNRIIEQRQYIMKNARTKEDIYRNMNLIGAEVARKHKK